jgi:hypothetical protein
VIACGQPDTDDLGNLHSLPAMPRRENVPDQRTPIRLARAMMDLWCQSYPRPPEAIILDFGDTRACPRA